MRLLDALGYERADFEAVLELPTGGAIDDLCAGRIDVTILITGHPSGTVADAIDRCGARIVPVDGPAVAANFAAGSDYVPMRIAARHYAALPADVPTYAVIATAVTRADVDDALVGKLVSSTLANLAELGLRAPVLAGLHPAEMRNRGLTAPLHPAAEAAFAAGTVGQ